MPGDIEAPPNPPEDTPGPEEAAPAPPRPRWSVGSVLRAGFPALATALLVIGAFVGMRRDRAAAPQPGLATPPPVVVVEGSNEHLMCAAQPVPAAAQAILVPVYCFGRHWYPAEQFEWKITPACGVAGQGRESYLVTKSGGPAVAIDDVTATLRDPRPETCGYMTAGEAAAKAADLKRLPADASGKYPAAAETYRVFQTRSISGR